MRFKNPSPSRGQTAVPPPPTVGFPLGALGFFSWVLVVQLIGLGVFTKGFFLTRVELGQQSECNILSLLNQRELEHLSAVVRRRLRGSSYLESDDTVGCWLPPRFKRVVWVVVDALRFDFAAYTPPDGEGGMGQHHSPGAKHYLNHLPVIQEAISGGRSASKSSNHAASSDSFEGTGGMLFQFEADPPTVTMQRLKGLTTGGLPTFIDFRDNFHSPEIAEDNWVAQVKARSVQRRAKQEELHQQQRSVAGRSGTTDGELVFMGDDTWTSLYPTYFSRSYPFPSFNTRDLHTVDDGVLAHLSEELEKKDWDVLVAHFLGVDHVGHTFGPASQAMEDKLEQMDIALRTVFAGVDDETVVFVLGDHGMTEDGNHGGATPEETGAALLVWSRSADRLFGSRKPPAGASSTKRNPISWETDRVEEDAGGKDFANPSAKSGSLGTVPTSRKVAQIDLVPTVSLLLGTPIPFGSLGGIIPELFSGRYAFEAAERDGEIGQEEEGVEGDMGDDPRHIERLCDALLVNSLQVWRYLSKYATVASMPSRDMEELGKLLAAARDAHEEWGIRQTNRAGPPNRPARAGELHEVCEKYRDFLDASIGLGRSLWTQYDTGLMCWGLTVLFLVVVALLARVTLGSGLTARDEGERRLWVADDGTGARAGAGGRVGVAVAYAHARRAPSERKGRYWGVGYYGLFSGGAGLIGALVGDTVFGFAGVHVSLAKMACCSCLGVCWYYIQQSFFVPRSYQSSSSLVGDSNQGSGELLRSKATALPALAGVVVPSVLAVLYCAGLFSNSFIEAEDGLHRFLGASALLALAALLAAMPSLLPSCSNDATVLSSWTKKRGSKSPTFTPFASEAAVAAASAASAADSATIYPCTNEDFDVRQAFDIRGLLRMPRMPRSLKGCAGCYVALAAVCLRLAAAVQDSHVGGGGGLTPDAGGAFSAVRAVLPLGVLWCLCRSARSHGDRSSSQTPRGVITSIATVCWRTIGGVRSRGGKAGLECKESGRGLAAAPPLRGMWCLFSWPVGGDVHGLLQAASLAAVVGYWVNEALTASQEAVSNTGPVLDGTEVGPGPNGVNGDDILFSFSIPIRLLLPRVTYALSLVGLILTALQPPDLSHHRRKRLRSSPPGSPSARGWGFLTAPPAAAAAAAAAEETVASEACGVGDDSVTSTRSSGVYADVPVGAAANIITHLVPVVVVLLGPSSAPIIMLMAMACGFALKGVSVAATVATTSRGVVPLMPLGAVAVTWSVVGRACFFLTGHHNQFSRLQYSAGFVGFDEFDFRVAGLLLFINTFGTEILVAFTVPLAAAAAATAATATAATAPLIRAPTIAIPAGPQRKSEAYRDEQGAEQPNTSFSTIPTPTALGTVVTGNRGDGARARVSGGISHGAAATGAVDYGHNRQPDNVYPPLPPPPPPAERDHARVDREAHEYLHNHDGQGPDEGDYDKEVVCDQEGEQAGEEERKRVCPPSPPPLSSFLSAMERLSGLMLLLSATRTFLSATNVSFQRGHLMLWAVFAPKFVFDATMQAVSGAAAVVVWAVVVARLQSRGFLFKPTTLAGGVRRGV